MNEATIKDPTMYKEVDEKIRTEFRSSLVEVMEHNSKFTFDIKNLRTVLPSERIIHLNKTFTLLSSTISVSGDNFDGMITIVGDERAIELFHPDESAITKDWIGELGNMVAGSFKRRLSKFGVKSVISLPMSIRGINLQFVCEGGNRYELLLRAPECELLVTINYQFRPDEISLDCNDLEGADAEAGSIRYF